MTLDGGKGARSYMKIFTMEKCDGGFQKIGPPPPQWAGTIIYVFDLNMY